MKNFRINYDCTGGVSISNLYPFDECYTIPGTSTTFYATLNDGSDGYFIKTPILALFFIILSVFVAY